MATYKVTFKHPAGHLVFIRVEASNKVEAAKLALPLTHAAVQMHYPRPTNVVKVPA